MNLDSILDLVPLALAVLALLWAGAVLGLSFIATPAKFGVQSLARPTAFEIGRHTFRVFNRVEWGFLFVTGVLLLISFAAGNSGPVVIALYILIAGALIIQSSILLPALNSRVEALVRGEPLPPSSHHAWYGVLELEKFLGLIVIGIAIISGF